MIRILSCACLSLIVLSLLAGCSPVVSTSPFIEPEIPANYATYTDEQGLYSISYPPDWVPELSYIDDAMEAVTDIIKSINEDVPIEKANMVFMAALQNEDGLPSVNILVEPMSTLVTTNKQLVDAEIKGIKSVISDYHEISRRKTIVDGREATILEWEGSPPQSPLLHPFQLIILVGRNAWCVTCSAPDGEFGIWENDFQSIVRSLRIHK